jgi:hypothetical protein
MLYIRIRIRIVFRPSWIQIRIRIENADSDKDPGARKLTKFTNKPDFHPSKNTHVGMFMTNYLRKVNFHVKYGILFEPGKV